MADVLIVGAWRNGLDKSTLRWVEEAEESARMGLLRPYEHFILTLVRLLDSYDTITEEFLLDA